MYVNIRMLILVDVCHCSVLDEKSVDRHTNQSDRIKSVPANECCVCFFHSNFYNSALSEWLNVSQNHCFKFSLTKY